MKTAIGYLIWFAAGLAVMPAARDVGVTTGPGHLGVALLVMVGAISVTLLVEGIAGNRVNEGGTK